MYPLSNLLQIKDENLQQELSELQNRIAELERYRNFSKVNELLESSKNILATEKNIDAIIGCYKKIDETIKFFRQPIEEKFSQLSYLNKLIVKFFDPIEAQGINSTLAIQNNKLKTEIDKDLIDPQEIENHLSQIDSIFYINFKKILGKIKQTLSEKSWDARYRNYLASQLELIHLSEKEINEKSTEISSCFDRIKFIIESITEFETYHDNFTNLAKNFTLAKEYFSSLTNILLNLDTVNSCKDEIESQIKILSKEFAEFDPRLNSFDTLCDGFQDLSQKLNELYQLNQCELQKQQDEFILLLKHSKQDLMDYADKLSLLKSKCAHNKSEQLQSIIEKIDLLLNAEIKMEENASNRDISSDKISDLKETLKNANSILSEYRGISLLRCFATLWGGGKITSKLLVNTLEEQLTDLQTNMARLSPSR